MPWCRRSCLRVSTIKYYSPKTTESANLHTLRPASSNHSSSFRPELLEPGCQRLCRLFPATTAACRSRGSWQGDASTLCRLFPATTAACINRGSQHRNASALCCPFSATTAACFNRGSRPQVASALRQDAGIFHLPAPSVPAAMSAGVVGSGMPAPTPTKQLSSAPSVIFPVTNGVDKKGRPVMHQVVRFAITSTVPDAPCPSATSSTSAPSTVGAMPALYACTTYLAEASFL